MGQKIRPTGFRTGIMIGWQSQWYANKQDFADLLVEDANIRKFVHKFLSRRGSGNRDQRPGISKIRIDRTREKVVVSIWSARPGLIIGKKGENIDKLTKKLEDLTHRHIEVKTIEVTRPETDPQLLAEDIAEQLEKRSSFRRTMKQAIQKSMEAGARGVKLQLSGRLGGAEMARCEKAMDGSIPLSTLRTRVEYGFAEASTAQGNIGIKVWVNNGDYLTEDTTDAANAQRVKYRKNQRGRVRGNASRGNTVSHGEFGLQSLEGGWLSAEALEAGRVTVAQFLRGEGRLYIRVFPHKSVTSIPAETRMGKGKGEPEYWAAVIKPGMVLYEIGGLPEAAARDCLARVSYKMPFKCRFVKRK